MQHEEPDRARSIGADHVVDYTQEDFTKDRQSYDLILAANGYHSILAYKRALSPGGKYVFVGGSMANFFLNMLLAPLISKVGSKKLSAVLATINQKDLTIMKRLLEAGKVKPVIDGRYPVSQVADAIRILKKDTHKEK